MIEENRIYKQEKTNNKMKREGNKKGQLSLFVIIAIVVVSGILVFFFVIKPNYIFDSADSTGFEGCINDAVTLGIEELGINGGFVTPEFSYPYGGENFVYLCYTNEYYKTCTVQRALLKESFEGELEKHLREKIDFCYSSSLDELRAQGNEVTGGEITYEINFEPGSVVTSINAPTAIGSQSFKKFNIKTNSHVYEMVMLATSIIQNEAHYGDYEVTAAMILQPDFTVRKMEQGEGTKLYVIESELFRNKFQFASRSLVLPPGNIAQ